MTLHKYYRHRTYRSKSGGWEVRRPYGPQSDGCYHVFGVFGQISHARDFARWSNLQEQGLLD
jgi:hypothetical protein